ncbi:hypothetical protein Patl1_03709 [Pistacia atlantica]|uniref:Uncharacterized protein n=1 Tax=Pistacia atlantica TaxID=434234 RepID=A0ACC1BQF4_9ROSI|nr:hypothetical protein Patl1_03709 [Pistacia atlantica]
MPSLKFCMFFLVLYRVCFVICLTSAADPIYVRHVCPNTTTFNRNSSHQSNLNFLLSSLVSNATRSNGFSTGFYNVTAGQDPDKVYALFLCRGDVTPTTCQDCVNFATSDILQRCPVQKESIIWYEQCLLRYSDASIFSALDSNDYIFVLSNSNNVTEQVRFDQLVRTTLKEAANEAVNSPKKFSTREANFTTVQTLYCIVQCTPDLSNFDCNSCLQQSFVSLPTARAGGRVLFPSCYSRFELYPFYNDTVTAAPPPTPVLSSPPPKDSYSRNEVIRCIHIGLLCVQEEPADRPTMATGVLMLNSYSVSLLTPQQPAFYIGSRREACNSMPTKELEFDQSKSKSMPLSVDDASITEVYPR